MLSKIILSTKQLNIILSILFFFSGCAALIYQILWERMLFSAFGVDLISITIIVSVFMFGLGLGGLCGGFIADKYTNHLLIFYLFIELSIALFGFISPFLFTQAGDFFLFESRFFTGTLCFLILAWPTILMGATFPILVTHVNKFNLNIGISVGNLYFVNTIGGAVGAYFAGFILLNCMDLAEAIYQAAWLNISIAVTVWLLFRRQP